VPFATTRTVSLDGVAGHLIDVQADIAQGMVSTALVGRPDASITEARDRCRAALANSGYSWPSTRRVTILLSPADLPKRGPHFDLSIAVAVLAADEKVPLEAAARFVMLGELTLDGRLRAVPGVLPMSMAARAHGHDHVLVPDSQVDEAALVPGLTVVGARSLQQVVAVLRNEPVPPASPVPPLATPGLLRWRGEGRTDELDLADVHGMGDARFALEVAAAGRHSLLLSGPKGAGKTTLAERLPGLLPDLSVEEALEVSAVHSLAGDLGSPRLDRRPPFRAPHHSATKTSVLGGGTGRVHPGELSRALHGVLFLDEFPLFNADIIDALRQPLESGEITIARGDEVATFPARTMMVFAANPCPCGDYSADARQSRCTCLETRRRLYRAKVTGPVSDRIDVTRHLTPVQPYEQHDRLSRPEPSSLVRARVERARSRQARRYAGTPWRVNGDVPGPELSTHWPLPPDAGDAVDHQIAAGWLTRRGAVRVHRIAWTLADLRERDEPGLEETVLAIRLRAGEPLPLDTLPGRTS
jgi:magnesium chelatase family protein